LYNRYLEQYGSSTKNRPVSVQDRTAPPPPPAPVQGIKQAAPAFTGHAQGLASLFPSSLTGIKGLLQGFLGDKMDISDLLLILILLLLYLEKEDEEILITLSALVFMGF
jgi:hypothetical protein